MGFSIISTIHFGVPLFLETPRYVLRFRDYPDPFLFFSDGIGTRKILFDPGGVWILRDAGCWLWYKKTWKPTIIRSCLGKVWGFFVGFGFVCEMDFNGSFLILVNGTILVNGLQGVQSEVWKSKWKWILESSHKKYTVYSIQSIKITS